ncbi:MAG: hypothetical protein NT030_07865 [Candidatus Saganbacteria bacterium]|nr:hypothetical protein [Candidatus Saganbacteria bacterium]
MKQMNEEIDKSRDILIERSNRFSQKLEVNLEHNLPAKELIEKMVRSALEVEFGPDFSSSKGFPKMVGAIADAIITNPDLRQQSLQVASIHLDKKDKKGKR